MIGYIEYEDLRIAIEEAIGPIGSWEVLEPDSLNPRRRFRFIPEAIMTLQRLEALSAAVGTTAINFNFGSEGEPGYSSVTPGCEGSPGYVEIVSPE